MTEPLNTPSKLLAGASVEFGGVLPDNAMGALVLGVPGPEGIAFALTWLQATTPERRATIVAGLRRLVDEIDRSGNPDDRPKLRLVKS